MKLHTIVNAMPATDTITIHSKGDILISCATVGNVLSYMHLNPYSTLKDCPVKSIEVGKVHGDLIIGVRLKK